ncbi:hypothetical protein H7Y29_00355 [Microbacteriaceae bacterium]|nr:hypothetical protein [Candidatus Saccharibacteria bacterium]
MGFMQNLGKLVNGEPMFTAEPSAPATQPETTVGTTQSNNAKVIPTIQLSNFKTSRNGSEMITEFWLQNTSNEQIRIESIMILGQKRDLHHYLEPNQEHQFIVYKGPAPKDTHNDDAEIYFRCERTNDYFKNKYMVEFDHQSDSTYNIDEFHQEGPTHDI